MKNRYIFFAVIICCLYTVLSNGEKIKIKIEIEVDPKDLVEGKKYTLRPLLDKEQKTEKTSNGNQETLVDIQKKENKKEEEKIKKISNENQEKLIDIQNNKPRIIVNKKTVGLTIIGLPLGASVVALVVGLVQSPAHEPVYIGLPLGAIVGYMVGYWWTGDAAEPNNDKVDDVLNSIK